MFKSNVTDIIELELTAEQEKKVGLMMDNFKYIYNYAIRAMFIDITLRKDKLSGIIKKNFSSKRLPENTVNYLVDLVYGAKHRIETNKDILPIEDIILGKDSNKIVLKGIGEVRLERELKGSELENLPIRKSGGKLKPPFIEKSYKEDGNSSSIHWKLYI